MNSPIYPIQLHRDFERRWAARMARDSSAQSPSEGTHTCVCGNSVTAPNRPTYSSVEITNYRHCGVCGTSWKTIAPSHVGGARQ
jgi:hypothetical protein